MATTKRQIEIQWGEFRDAIKASTPVDTTETPAQQRARIAKLEAHPEDWFVYYFPKFAYSKPAPFHRAATRRVLGNMEWYEVRNWSRELAKSTRTMMEVLYLTLTGQKRYVLLISNNETNAGNLLEPYRINLEANQRINNDYGTQQTLGRWTFGEFTTRKRVAFKAVGAGQSPRGTRNEEVRPDVLLFDDLDTDEDCRNPEIIDKRWRWIEDAAIGTRSISKGTTIIFCGNIIAKDCCVVRAHAFADKVDIVNIRDKDGKSSWPEKNTEEHIERVLSQKSYISVQREYYNNPITEGAVFKQMHYKALPNMKGYPFLVCYIDLSYKSTSRNDYKAAVLLGRKGNEYHLHKCFLKQGTTRDLAVGLVDIKRHVNGATPIYFIAEENFLQDVVLKELNEHFTDLKESIMVSGDPRKKGDKFSRIESALQPLNDNGRLWLSEAEKDNPSMMILDEQFRALQPKSKAHDDGPDATEGAKQIIDEKYFEAVPPTIGNRQPNSKRY